MKKVSLLGVGMECKTRSEYRTELSRLAQGGWQALVVTPNPEMLVASERFPSLKDILNAADMRLVDGFGLVLASGFRLSRFPGVDALAFLCEEASRHGLKVLLAGGMHEGDAQKAASRLRRYCDERTSNGAKGTRGIIVGCSPGVIALTELRWVGDEGLKKAIERERPDVLALALGHGKQEKWLADHLKQFPFVKLGIGIGGALEFYAGRQKRAPALLRRSGLEWLYRLLQEPRRLKRIFTAVIVFPYLVFLEKIKHTSRV